MNTTTYTLRIYLGAAKRYWASGLLTVALIIVGTVSTDILAPYVTSRVFALLPEISSGRGGTAHALTYWWWLVGLGVLTFVSWRIVGFVNVPRQPRILRNLEQQIFDHLTTQSYGFFANRFGGALVAQSGRFVRGYEILEDIAYFELLPGLVRLIASAGVLIVLLPPVGAALFIWSALFVGSIIWMTKLKQPMTRRASDADSAVTARLADVIANVLNLIVFGRRGGEQRAYGATVDRQRKLRQRSWFFDELIMAYQVFIIIAFELLFIWLAITLVSAHTAGLAVVLLAQFYIARIIGDLWSVGRITKRTSKVFGDTAEMAKILDQRPEIRDPARPKRFYLGGGGIRFEHVTFAYPGHPPVYRNFSLTIKPGERVGLVGPSGGGKSTLVKLLLRFADVRSGRILVDEQPIRSIRQEDLRRGIAYVPQEPILFHRSLEENIRYGRDDATKAEVREAARLARAEEFIEALPKGYRTLVGERGIKLSGGERQRVAIARAILSPAPILLLDEATSSLDSASEKLISAALKKLMQDRTTLVIAHRLSTIRNLDRILVMEHGRIAESGTHQVLLDRGGVYAELWRHQSGGFIGEQVPSKPAAR